jgi:hypothetical protein
MYNTNKLFNVWYKVHNTLHNIVHNTLHSKQSFMLFHGMMYLFEMVYVLQWSSSRNGLISEWYTTRNGLISEWCAYGNGDAL